MRRSGMRKTAGSLILLALGLLALFHGARPAPPEEKSLVLLFTHDLHSSVLPRREPGPSGETVLRGGFARIATLIREERSRNAERTLALDGGDFSMGTLFHTLYSGDAAELRLLGLMGIDATTLGNHEFDFRSDGLARSLRAAKAAGEALPALTVCNVDFEGDSEDARAGRAAFAEYPVRHYLVFERGGLRVGVFGLFSRLAADDSPFAAPAVFADPEAQARRLVQILRGKERVDLVICLSHGGTSSAKERSVDEKLARDVPGIDIIISGHSHTVLEKPLAIEKTLIVSSGDLGRFLGRLEIARGADGSLRTISYDLLPVGPGIPEDPAVVAAAAAFQAEVERRFLSGYPGGIGQVLAESSFTLETVSAMDGHPVESAIGDLITDAFREAIRKAEGGAYKHVHMAVEPAGVIRDTILRGPVTIDDVFRILSLGMGDDGRPGYPLLAPYLTGRELKRLLEVHASVAPINSDASLQVSGVRFSYNPRRLIFDRVTRVSVLAEDGVYRPLDPRALYRIALNSYTAGMVDYVSRASKGLLRIRPRDASGRLLAKDMEAAVDADATQPGIQEVKEWAALGDYLRTFPDADGNGIPDIPARYQKPEGRHAAAPSWNPIALIAGTNGLTLVFLAIVAAVAAGIVLIVRAVRKRRRRRKAAGRS